MALDSLLSIGMQSSLFWKVLLLFFSSIILTYIKAIYYKRKNFFYGMGLNFRLSKMGGGNGKEGS